MNAEKRRVVRGWALGLETAAESITTFRTSVDQWRKEERDGTARARLLDEAIDELHKIENGYELVIERLYDVSKKYLR